MVRWGGLLLAFALSSCAVAPRPAEGPVPALLLGEQHDAPEHQRLHRQVVEQLAARGVLAAVVLEMAEAGRSTRGLPPSASEAEAQAALKWNDAAWPWAAYGPAVMAAVRAGIPVVGANLDAQQMKAAMGDASLDAVLPDAARREQLEAIRAGHCGMLPEAHLPAMARVQVARDRAMARAITAAAAPGKTVVLIAGSGHVDPTFGVPVHLGTQLRAKAEPLPPVETGKDYCAELRRSREKKAS